MSNILIENEGIAREYVYRTFQQKIDFDKLPGTCLMIAKYLEPLSYSGPKKLDILQGVLRKAAETLPEDKKGVVLSVIDTVVPMVVQGAVLASKSPIVSRGIQEVEAVCITCWKK